MPAVPTTNTGGNPFLDRAYASTDAETSRVVYEDWASTYEDDMEAQEYVAPSLVAEAAAKYTIALERAEILDAGCGTGFVGVALSKLGATKIDGLDISSSMLQLAGATSVYRRLETADLKKSLKQSDGRYDAVVCAGTLTRGHVGPEAIAELIRVTRANGILIATILEDIWESAGFRAEVDRLVGAGFVKLISNESVGYRRSANVGAKLLVLRKIER